ncbi:MAG: 30S ribosomal protein S8 [Candidatus Micrarchaeota archaeon]|nr:30S ribosomal protein S8 [Candidatus Micrarchaeota archaeon]
MVDVFADTINKIKLYENAGRYDCVVPSTRLIRAVLDTMKANKYIKDYSEFKEGKFNMLKIELSKRINDIGVIKPRHAVRFAEFQKYEMRYIPSNNFGILVVSTQEGIMTNRDARSKRLGGRLIAYVY